MEHTQGTTYNSSKMYGYTHFWVGSYIFTTVESTTNKVIAAKAENAEVEAFTSSLSSTTQNPTTTFSWHFRRILQRQHNWLCLPLTLQVSCTSSLQGDIHLQYLLHRFFSSMEKYSYFSTNSHHVVHSVFRNRNAKKSPWRIKVEKLYLGLSFQELPYSNVHTHTVLNSKYFNEVTSNMTTALFCREKKKSVRGSKVFWKL